MFLTSRIVGWNAELGAVQKLVNLVDGMNIYLRRSTSITPRKDRPKFVCTLAKGTILLPSTSIKRALLRDKWIPQSKSASEPPPAQKIHNPNPAPHPRRPGKRTIQIRPRTPAGPENPQSKSGSASPPARTIHNPNPAPDPRRPGKSTIQIH